MQRRRIKIKFLQYTLVTLSYLSSNVIATRCYDMCYSVEDRDDAEKSVKILRVRLTTSCIRLLKNKSSRFNLLTRFADGLTNAKKTHAAFERNGA